MSQGLPVAANGKDGPRLNLQSFKQEGGCVGEPSTHFDIERRDFMETQLGIRHDGRMQQIVQASRVGVSEAAKCATSIFGDF